MKLTNSTGDREVVGKREGRALLESLGEVDVIEAPDVIEHKKETKGVEEDGDLKQTIVHVFLPVGGCVT